MYLFVSNLDFVLRLAEEFKKEAQLRFDIEIPATLVPLTYLHLLIAIHFYKNFVYKTFDEMRICNILMELVDSI